MRWLPPSLIALAMVLLIAAPAAAPAAEEAPEAPASEAPPPSGGWVPQDPAPEGGGDAPAPAQQGSSLGSGERSSPAPSTSDPAPEPSSPPPAPVETYEREPSATVTEESRSTPAPAPEPAPAPPPVAKVEPDPGVPPAVGAAHLVARPASSGEAEDDSATSAAAEQVAGTVNEDSGGLPWLALILCGLVLLYAGMRVLLGPVEPEFFRSGRFRFVRRVFPGA